MACRSMCRYPLAGGLRRDTDSGRVRGRENTERPFETALCDRRRLRAPTRQVGDWTARLLPRHQLEKQRPDA